MVSSNKNELSKIFADIDSQKDMEKFFHEIFTPAERNDLALRWELMKMIHNKLPQRKIASELKVSLCKITRGAKILKNNDSITKKIL
ncbi:MAG: transcriptional regulator, partial [Planctomycetes bacterium]|nr:transcriptional regulator [Planctomycetota bacterium]